MSNSWSRTTRYFVLVLVLGALLWLISSARALIAPLAISALLAYVLNPVVAQVNQRSKLNRSVVVMSVYVIFVVALVVVGILLAPVLPGYLSGLSTELNDIILQVERGLAQPVVIFGVRMPLDELLSELPATLSSSSPDVLFNIIGATTTNLGWVLVILVTTYYLLLDYGRLRSWVMGVVPTVHQPDAQRLYREVKAVWQRYLQGQLRLMVIIGVLTGLASAAIGLPGAWAFGVFAGLFDVILSVGPAVVMAVAAIVAFFLGSNFLPISNIWFSVLVLVIYGVIQTLENVWLRPRIMGNALRLHPAIVFVGVIGSLALGGILLALIIVPLMGTTFVVGRYLYCKILDIQPWPEQASTAETAMSPDPESTTTVASELPDRSW